MSIMQMLLAAKGLLGYLMDKSVRLRASASAYLNRTFTTPTNNKKWTWSGWVKRGSISGYQCFFGAGNNSNTVYAYAGTNAANNLDFYNYNGSTTFRLTTTAVFRDPSAWYHIVFVCDTDNATSSDRVQIWVNGVRVTAFTTATYPSSGAAVLFNDAAQVQTLGLVRTVTYNTFFDGYLADVYFIDGQALTPASFGETNALTGVWQSKAYTGTYGTNGFYLDFEDTSSVAALGTDKSGNGNTWTVNNVSLTAGVTYDSMTDVPTLTSATAANYCVMNPVNISGMTLSNGNLTQSQTATAQGCRSTFAMTSGKYYWEITNTTGSSFDTVGIVPVATPLTFDLQASGSNAVVYYAFSGNKVINGTDTAYGATYTTNDVIGVAVDIDNNSITFYKNGTSQGQITGLSLSGNSWYVASGNENNGSNTKDFNFGQRPFAYTPPTGFKALNTFNIDEGTITTSGTFTGNASADGPSINLNGVPTAMTINGNAVTFGTHADKVAYGFKLRTTSSSYNTVGSNTYSVSTTGAKFKYANAQSNP